MSLAAGAKLDHYEILERIGVGGMGEVFRARDTRLPREVAIKVSTQAFNERFARETKVIASLNHPNICTLFDVGANYLVMELVDGATLQEHIKQGPMSLEEASRIGRQIADALDYAHEHGVIHRDLKPANIKVRPDGVVKVLDFGLAKAIQASNPDEVATVTLGATQAGAILGTPNYMSPEQATGRPTDKRSDTWAFGIVFYEMLAGGKPFGGSTIQETIAATLRDAPDLSKVPPQARRLLRKCLEKDPQNRLKHLGDVMSLLDEPPSLELAPGSVPGAPTKRNRIWPALAAVGLLAALGVGTLHFSERPVPPALVRFDFNAPAGVTLTRTGGFSMSPDGKTIAFAATQEGTRGTHIWLRRLDSTEMRRLDWPTDPDPFPPIWSADSRSLIYENGDSVMKADIANGTPQVLCEKCNALGGAWGTDGTILLGGLSGIFRLPANGGAPVKLVNGDRQKAEAVLHPVLLPDGKHFLYLMSLNDASHKIGLKVGAIDLKPEQQSKEWLMDVSAGVSWIPSVGGNSGQLLYLVGATLMARDFDPGKLAFTGEPRPVASQIGYSQNWAWGLFSASTLGHLVYRTAAQTNLQQLTWFDRTGKELSKVDDPGVFSVVVLSPDSKRAGVALSNNALEDIWIEDLIAGTRTRLTAEPGPDSQPVWSRDGANVFYYSLRGDHWEIVRSASNGAAGEEIIYTFPKGASSPNLSDSSPDGKLLVYHQGGNTGGTDIFQIESKPDSPPKVLLQTQFMDAAARISPDGRWFIYRNNESGRHEIYVQAMPGYGAPAGKWRISREGGIGGARWRRDGREVLFLSLDGAVMAADVKLSPTFESGPPHKLFDVPATFKTYFNGGVPGSLFDMTTDGQRFLFAVPTTDSAIAPFQVVTDWRTLLGK